MRTLRHRFVLHFDRESGALKPVLHPKGVPAALFEFCTHVAMGRVALSAATPPGRSHLCEVPAARLATVRKKGFRAVRLSAKVLFTVFPLLARHVHQVFFRVWQFRWHDLCASVRAACLAAVSMGSARE